MAMKQSIDELEYWQHLRGLGWLEQIHVSDSEEHPSFQLLKHLDTKVVSRRLHCISH